MKHIKRFIRGVAFLSKGVDRDIWFCGFVLYGLGSATVLWSLILLFLVFFGHNGFFSLLILAAVVYGYYQLVSTAPSWAGCIERLWDKFNDMIDEARQEFD